MKSQSVDGCFAFTPFGDQFRPRRIKNEDATPGILAVYSCKVSARAVKIAR